MLTPDDIRSAIASNPQSQETRVYLISQAVENDMADEVPDEWTVDLYNAENGEPDDEMDLIADEYKLSDYDNTGDPQQSPQRSPLDPQWNVVIAAHESGALSIRVSPEVKPLVKFDIETTDRLIDMISAAGNWLAYHTAGSAPPQEVEPVTGISLLAESAPDASQGTARGAEFFLSIPGQDEDWQGHDFAINQTWRIWLNGLTAMANAAETYGRQDVLE